MVSQGGQPPYEVVASLVIRNLLYRLQRRATRQGRGEVVMAAFASIVQELRRNPEALGEPLYGLPALRL